MEAGQPCILGPALLLTPDTVLGPRQQEYNCLYCCKALQQGKYTVALLLQGPAAGGGHDRQWRQQGTWHGFIAGIQSLEWQPINGFF